MGVFKRKLTESEKEQALKDQALDNVAGDYIYEVEWIEDVFEVIHDETGEVLSRHAAFAAARLREVLQELGSQASRHTRVLSRDGRLGVAPF